MGYAEAEAAPMEESADAGSSDYINTPPLERKIIKNSYIELEIGAGEFEDKLFEITDIAENNGGFVSSSESYSDAEGKLTSGRIIVRVPAEKFDPVINKVKALGEVNHISMSGQDVTEEYIDLQSRLRNLKVQEEVLLDLMEQSKSVEDSIAVQRELSNVQGEIEVLQGRLNYLDNMVSFSTIEVYLTEPTTIREASDWGFMDAIRRGAKGAVRVFNGLISALIIISPVLIFVAIIVVIIWLIVRSVKEEDPEKRSDLEHEEPEDFYQFIINFWLGSNCRNTFCSQVRGKHQEDTGRESGAIYWLRLYHPDR
ncbi:MAG: DUF4349 domain-containing protein [Actinomycetota bacterium]|nr:DUF4349 domain-containing protein [Actinomycetota bacterium]